MPESGTWYNFEHEENDYDCGCSNFILLITTLLLGHITLGPSFVLLICLESHHVIVAFFPVWHLSMPPLVLIIAMIYFLLLLVFSNSPLCYCKIWKLEITIGGNYLFWEYCWIQIKCCLQFFGNLHPCLTLFDWWVSFPSFSTSCLQLFC